MNKNDLLNRAQGIIDEIRSDSITPQRLGELLRDMITIAAKGNSDIQDLLGAVIRNVSQATGDYALTPLKARDAVPQDKRRKGSILAYRTDSGDIIEMFTGADIVQWDNPDSWTAVLTEVSLGDMGEKIDRLETKVGLISSFPKRNSAFKFFRKNWVFESSLLIVLKNNTPGGITGYKAGSNIWEEANGSIHYADVNYVKGRYYPVNPKGFFTMEFRKDGADVYLWLDGVKKALLYNASKPIPLDFLVCADRATYKIVVDGEEAVIGDGGIWMDGAYYTPDMIADTDCPKEYKIEDDQFFVPGNYEPVYTFDKRYDGYAVFRLATMTILNTPDCIEAAIYFDKKPQATYGGRISWANGYAKIWYDSRGVGCDIVDPSLPGGIIQLSATSKALADHGVVVKREDTDMIIKFAGKISSIRTPEKITSVSVSPDRHINCYALNADNDYIFNLLPNRKKVVVDGTELALSLIRQDDGPENLVNQAPTPNNYSRSRIKLATKAYCSIIDDDGLSKQYTHLVPYCEALGIRCGMAIITGLIGANHYLTESQIKDMSSRGFDILSHSVSHANLIEMADEQVRYEVEFSRRTLEDIVGKTVDHFVSPFGRCNDRVADIISEKYINHYSFRHHAGLSFNTFDNINNYNIQRIGVDIWGHQVDYIKAEIDKAIEAKGWVVLCTHVGAEAWGQAQYDKLTEIIQYIKSQPESIEILKPSEAFRIYANMHDTDGNIRINAQGVRLDTPRANWT